MEVHWNAVVAVAAAAAAAAGVGGGSGVTGVAVLVAGVAGTAVAGVTVGAAACVVEKMVVIDVERAVGFLVVLSVTKCSLGN